MGDSNYGSVEECAEHEIERKSHGWMFLSAVENTRVLINYTTSSVTIEKIVCRRFVDGLQTVCRHFTDIAVETILRCT